MASAEDSRVPLERIGGMDRELLEQQARADQATAALQGMQGQQTSNGRAARLAQRLVAASQAAGGGGSDVVDTRLLVNPVAFDGR